MTVVETPSFLREAAAVLTEEERVGLLWISGLQPRCGRSYARERRGVRVIYYYHHSDMPLFLLKVFAKNEKGNLTNAERNEMKNLLPRLIAGYRKRFKK